MEKILILFVTILGVATMYQAKTNRSRVMSFSVGQCTVKEAMKSVRLGAGAIVALFLNVFLILSIIIYNM